MEGLQDVHEYCIIDPPIHKVRGVGPEGSEKAGRLRSSMGHKTGKAVSAIDQYRHMTPVPGDDTALHHMLQKLGAVPPSQNAMSILKEPKNWRPKCTTGESAAAADHSHVVSRDKTSRTIQRMVDAAPEAEHHCTDGYSGYLDVVDSGRYIYNIHNKNDTFTAEGVNADLRHHIPTLARRSRCFPRKLENLQAVLAVFVRVYDRFGLQTHLYRSRHPGTSVPFSLFAFF